MINKANQTIAVLVATNVVTYIVGAELIKALAKERRQKKNLYAFTVYLISVIEQNGINLDEFDLIALSNLSEEHNATE
jgi:hypothetical protein